MEKIAVISDIHSNLPALDAVLKDVARRRIRRIVCLGDLVGKGPQPAEAVDRVRERCDAVVQGNWDVGVGRERHNAVDRWQRERTGAERIEYLAGLPFSLDLRLSGHHIRLFHASADSVFHRVKRKASKEEKLSMFANTEQTGTPEDGGTPDIVGYGDIHIPYVITMKTAGKSSSAADTNNPAATGLTLFNTGSVGVPYDGIPQPCYAILEGAAGAEPAPFAIQLIRVPYDLELAVQAAKAAEMPGSERYIAEIHTAVTHK